MPSALPIEPILLEAIQIQNHHHKYDEESRREQLKNRSVRTFSFSNLKEYFRFKNSLKLSLNSFSSQFMQGIGLSNTQGTYGVESPFNTTLFCGLTECEAQQQVLEGQNRKLSNILNLNNFYVRYDITKKPIEWTVNSKINGNSLVELTQVIFNISGLDALATLAYIVRLNIDNFYFFQSANPQEPIRLPAGVFRK